MIIGREIREPSVDTNTILDAKTLFPSYFSASMAVVLAAGIAESRTQTLAGKTATSITRL